MAPIDRLGWADGFSVRPHGIVFGVRSNDKSLLDRIRAEVLLPCWPVGPYQHEVLYSFFAGAQRKKGVRDFTLLYQGSTMLVRSHDLEAAYRLFETTFHEAVASLSTAASFVRGLSLAVDGTAVAVLNADHQWLADTAEGLRLLGASLLSANFIVLDQLGLVHPYLNRVQLQEQLQDAKRLGLPLGSEALPLGAVLVANSPRAGALSRAEVAWHLFGQLQGRFGPGLLVRHLSQAVRARTVQGAAVQGQKGLLKAIEALQHPPRRGRGLPARAHQWIEAFSAGTSVLKAEQAGRAANEQPERHS